MGSELVGQHEGMVVDAVKEAYGLSVFTEDPQVGRKLTAEL